MPYYKQYPEPNMPPDHARLPMSSGMPHSGSMRRSSLSQAAWVNGRPEPYPHPQHMHPGHGPKYAMGGYPGRPMQPNGPAMHRPIAAHPPSSNPPQHPPSAMRPRPFPSAPPPGYSQSYPLLTSTQAYPTSHPPQAYPQGHPGAYPQGHHPASLPFQPHPNQPMHHFQSPQSHPQPLNLQQHHSPRPGSGPGQVPASAAPPSRQSKGMLDFIMNP